MNEPKRQSESTINLLLGHDGNLFSNERHLIKEHILALENELSTRNQNTRYEVRVPFVDGELTFLIVNPNTDDDGVFDLTKLEDARELAKTVKDGYIVKIIEEKI